MNSKVFVIVLIYFFYQTVSGQEDLQWLVKDGQLRSGVGYTAPSIMSTNKYYTVGVGVPINGGCNDFFAFFSNGDYYMSDWNSPCSLPVVSNPATYKLEVPTGNQLNGLYLTKRYEDDDPPGSVETEELQPVGGGGSSTAFEVSNVNMSDLNMNYGLLTNQDIVNGDDITFVIDKLTIENTKRDIKVPCDNEVKLCYDTNVLDDLYFVRESLDGTSNVFSVGNYYSAEFDGNCITLPYTGKNIIANFRVDLESELLIGTDIEFTLYSCNKSIEYIIPVSNQYHDPNFIELKCVWEEDNKKYARYRIECFNDGIGHFKPMTLETILPSKAISSTVLILDWMAKNIDGCGTSRNARKVNLNPPSLVKMKFCEGLDGFSNTINSNFYTGWFEFIVELDPSTNLVFDNLEASLPKSNFDGTDYAITTFHDHMKCYTSTELIAIYPNSYDIQDLSILNDSLFTECRIGRVVGKCGTDCNTKQVNITTIKQK